MVHNLVSIGIVNWNGGLYLARCLECVNNQDYNGGIEVIIVDNGSKDQSLEALKVLKGECTVIRNSSNRGFAYANNQVIRASSGEFFLALNFDAFLEPNFLTETVKAMRQRPMNGMVSGKLYRMDRRNNELVLDTTGIQMKHCFMHPRGANEIDRGQYDHDGHLEIFGACGAAALYRRSMLEDIKYKNEYFDEDFVNYVEDVDLSWRSQLRGWKCVYCPSAIAFHKRRATRPACKEDKEYQFWGYRNRYCSMLKNITADSWKKNKSKIIMRELLFLMSYSAHVSRRTRIKSLLLSTAKLKRMLIKRGRIQQKSVVTDDYMDQFFSYKNFTMPFSKKSRHAR